MRRPLFLAVLSVASILSADIAAAHPHNYNRGRQAENHYYNGRWVDDHEWQRHGRDRDRWERHHRRSERRDNGSSALVGGIIGFALGAAIVGSQQQAERAKMADESWDDRCAKKYRSYDAASKTYMGYDGVRHYCR
jgi:hypothetical protein